MLQATLKSAYKLLTRNVFSPLLAASWYSFCMPAQLRALAFVLPPQARAGLLAALILAVQGCATQERYVPPARTAAPGRHVQAAEPPRQAGQRGPAAEVVITALNFLDAPYRYGGTGAGQGFDCSGFTRHVYDASLGLLLPRSADDQAHAASLAQVDVAELQPGDLVFFNTLQRTYSHVGIYVGEGRFIHAPRSGSRVRVEDMRLAYWAQRYTGARRAADAGDTGATTLVSTNH